MTCSNARGQKFDNWPRLSFKALIHGRDQNLLHIQDAAWKKFRLRKTSRQEWKYHGQPGKDISKSCHQIKEKPHFKIPSGMHVFSTIKALTLFPRKRMQREEVLLFSAKIQPHLTHDPWNSRAELHSSEKQKLIQIWPPDSSKIWWNTVILFQHCSAFCFTK